MLHHIMHRASTTFLPKITLLCWSNHHTHQTWLTGIFSCSLNSRVSKGTRFPDVEAIKMAMTKLQAILDRSFQECMEAWQRRMAKCVRSQGDYVEGDMLSFTICIWNKRFMHTVSLLFKHTSYMASE